MPKHGLHLVACAFGPKPARHDVQEVRPLSTTLSHGTHLTPNCEYVAPVQLVQLERAAFGSVPATQLSHADCTALATLPSSVHAEHAPPTLYEPAGHRVQSDAFKHLAPAGHVKPGLHLVTLQLMR